MNEEMTYLTKSEKFISELENKKDSYDNKEELIFKLFDILFADLCRFEMSRTERDGESHEAHKDYMKQLREGCPDIFDAWKMKEKRK